jgi:hypothetical protein
VTATATAGCYVFGIVPADAEVPDADTSGPAADLHLVVAGDLAALVGRVPVDRPLGRAADLRAHDRVLADVVAAGSPVLPMRFGAVLTDDDAVVHELLEPHLEQFRDALDTLRGRVQYTVTVRYDEAAILAEVLAAHPEIRRLRREGNEPADPAAQLELGRLVVGALEQLRPDDASAVLTELMGTVDVRVRDAVAPDEVLDAAFLVDADRAAAFEEHVEQVAARHHARMRVTLVGPTAAYDFVGDG